VHDEVSKAVTAGPHDNVAELLTKTFNINDKSRSRSFSQNLAQVNAAIRLPFAVSADPLNFNDGVQDTNNRIAQIKAK
jgi:hypothetical protein